MARFHSLAKGAFVPDRGEVDPKACEQAATYGQFWGPFAELAEAKGTAAADT